MFFSAGFSAFLLYCFVVLTGVVWPCFLVLWRCSTLNVGFIRMVVEHKLQHAEDERQQEVKDLHRKNTIECKPGCSVVRVLTFPSHGHVDPVFYFL
jgi:fatty acid desaturase